jgi:hypothetical protein
MGGAIMTTSTGSARGASGIWATGLVAFAAAMLIMLGVFQMLEGLAALVNDEVLVTVRGYVYEFDVTAWGWTHLLIGAGAALTGVFLIRGAVWARAVGIFVAGLSAVANFLFIPYYPVWSLLIIALNVAVIWALVSYDSGPS